MENEDFGPADEYVTRLIRIITATINSGSDSVRINQRIGYDVIEGTFEGRNFELIVREQ